jgi:hypothetical protein
MGGLTTTLHVLEIHSEAVYDTKISHQSTHYFLDTFIFIFIIIHVILR